MRYLLLPCSRAPRLLCSPAPWFLYGSGLRLMECVRLCVKDLDFAQRQIIVRDAKSMKDRVTILPQSLIPFLQEHPQHVKKKT